MIDKYSSYFDRPSAILPKAADSSPTRTTEIAEPHLKSSETRAAEPKKLTWKKDPFGAVISKVIAAISLFFL